MLDMVGIANILYIPVKRDGTVDYKQVCPGISLLLALAHFYPSTSEFTRQPLSPMKATHVHHKQLHEWCCIFVHSARSTLQMTGGGFPCVPRGAGEMWTKVQQIADPEQVRPHQMDIVCTAQTRMRFAGHTPAHSM